MHHDEFQKQEGRIFTPSFFILLTLVLIGAFLIGVRCVKGLGAVSNMSDGYPWGIWITYDVAIGTAMACGGYAMALLVYIRNRMRYHPLIRSCIVTSMFGYGLAGFSVMVDLGRPWNFYNFFVPSKWQMNSVMFEVALCIMSYTTVLLIEFLPAMLVSLETSDWRRLRATLGWLRNYIAVDTEFVINQVERLRAVASWVRPRLDQVLIFFIILGVTLPTMHQSSLGSMLLVAATKLHPLWHTGFLPLLFLLNCMYIGYSIAIIQLLITAYAFKRPYDLDELSGVARIIPWLTAVWLVVAIADLTYRHQWAAAFRFDLYSCSFLTELALIVNGSILALRKSNRFSPRGLYASAALIVLGGGLYRVNVYMIGFDPGQGWKYFPSLPEILVTVGIVALEILGYQVLVKLCPVLPRIKLPAPTQGHSPRPSTPRATGGAEPYPVLNRRIGNSTLEPV